MPKLKTHRGAAKRFKKTASGKFKRAKAYQEPHPHEEGAGPEARPRAGDAPSRSPTPKRVREMLPYA